MGSSFAEIVRALMRPTVSSPTDPKNTSRDGRIPLEESVLIEQFMGRVPENLAIWLREKKPTSLQATAEMDDDYVAARKAEGKEFLHLP